MKVKDLIKDLQQYKDPNFEIVAFFWRQDDIEECAEELGIELSKEEVSEVIRWLERKADTGEGIDWDTIGYAIEYIKGF